MSAVTATISEDVMKTVQAKPALRDEGAKLGFRLTLPAQILVLFIAVFPLLMQLYISLTDWSPLSGLGWWSAWSLWNNFANYTDLAVDARFLERAEAHGHRHDRLRAGGIPAGSRARHAVCRRVSRQADLLLDPSDADDGGAGCGRLHVLHAVPVRWTGQRHPVIDIRLPRHHRLAFGPDAGAHRRNGRRYLAVDAADVPHPACRPRRRARGPDQGGDAARRNPGSASSPSCCRR